jgi:hypothetical protein
MSLSNHKQCVQVVLLHDRIKTTLSSNELHLGLGLGVLDRVDLRGGKRAFQDLLTVMTGRHLDVGVFLVEAVKIEQNVGLGAVAIRSNLLNLLDDIGNRTAATLATKTFEVFAEVMVAVRRHDQSPRSPHTIPQTAIDRGRDVSRVLNRRPAGGHHLDDLLKRIGNLGYEGFPTRSAPRVGVDPVLFRRQERSVLRSAKNAAVSQEPTFRGMPIRKPAKVGFSQLSMYCQTKSH